MIVLLVFVNSEIIWLKGVPEFGFLSTGRKSKRASKFIIPILFMILVKNIWIDYEETKLKKIFGQEYLNYQKKVRRWI